MRPMDIFKTITQIFGLAEVLAGWRTTLRKLNGAQRAKVAAYCDTVADTLARASDALLVLSMDASQARSKNKAARDTRRELARLAGNVSDIAILLEGHLDGRKIAGVKRRLKGIVERQTIDAMLLETRKPGQISGFKRRLEMLSEAEGEFRALGDGLKV